MRFVLSSSWRRYRHTQELMYTQPIWYIIRNLCRHSNYLVLAKNELKLEIVEEIQQWILMNCIITLPSTPTLESYCFLNHCNMHTFFNKPSPHIVEIGTTAYWLLTSIDILSRYGTGNLATVSINIQVFVVAISRKTECIYNVSDPVSSSLVLLT